MNKLLKEAIELLKHRVDPRHSKRPSADDVRDWIDRCKAHIVQQDTTDTELSVGIIREKITDRIAELNKLADSTINLCRKSRYRLAATDLTKGKRK